MGLDICLRGEGAEVMMPSKLHPEHLWGRTYIRPWAFHERLEELFGFGLHHIFEMGLVEPALGWHTPEAWFWGGSWRPSREEWGRTLRRAKAVVLLFRNCPPERPVKDKNGRDMLTQAEILVEFVEFGMEHKLTIHYIG